MAYVSPFRANANHSVGRFRLKWGRRKRRQQTLQKLTKAAGGRRGALTSSIRPSFFVRIRGSQRLEQSDMALGNTKRSRAHEAIAYFSSILQRVGGKGSQETGTGEGSFKLAILKGKNPPGGGRTLCA